MALGHVPRHRAYVGLGGNVGEVRQRLGQALAGLAHLPGSALEAVSPLYRTRPFEADGPDYLNAVVVLRASLGPCELLACLQALETQHERTRPYHHAPRTLDLDLLFYGQAQRQTARLSLPHPRWAQRAFVLAPLAAVARILPPDPFSPPPALTDEARLADLVAEQGVVRLPPDAAWPEGLTSGALGC